MKNTTRFVLLVLGALFGAAVALCGVIALLAPGVVPAGQTPSLLADVVGGRMAATLQIAAGLAAVGVTVLAWRATVSTGRGGGGEGAPAVLRAVALVVALTLSALTPGGIIAVAGYSFVLVSAGILLAGLMLLVRSKPLIGTLLALAGVAVLVLAATRLPLATFVPLYAQALLPRVPELVVSAMHLGAAGTLAAWALGDPAVRGGFARAVLHHRRAITVAAAVCAAPYVIARASWLTPWPLFGGDGAAAHPGMLMVGLLLGGAMVVAGLLTLSLCLPWADRFPRWLGALGGRAVPVGLTVIPASLVALMFTTGGVEFVQAVAAAGRIHIDSVTLLLVLPFWLWGPLLALATWGYAMHRGGADEAAPAPRATRLRGRPAAMRMRAMQELEAIEERDPPLAR